MTTLLGVYNSQGCVGRCDAKCYMAMSKHCDCICGGRNHGVGVQQAIENTAARVGLEPADLVRFAAGKKLVCEELVVIDRTEHKDAAWARELAYHKLNQLELPFESESGRDMVSGSVRLGEER